MPAELHTTLTPDTPVRYLKGVGPKTAVSAMLVNYFLPRPRVVSLWEGFKGLFRKDSKV